MKATLHFALGALLVALVTSGCQSYSPSATSWEVLFDGTSMEQATRNFRGYRKTGFPEGWAMDGEALKTVPGHGGADIMTRQMYANFELEFEWAVSPGGNSGVMYYVAESGEEAWQTGPEYQLLDDAGHADGKNPKTSAGGLYALIAPDVAKMLVPVGQFNRGRIVVNRGHVEHWLNGQRVVEYQWGSPPVQALIAQSKFASLPRFMKERTGYVVFQHHGEEAWLRNIRIRRL
ncbi:MAG TPA: DUF1080 domain-containing protein [Verrucomicrobiales bacterium]|nr:DUF1080 domain-containing protein [Verrucomicrobiales bacterium]